ncbi:uncharacterized protein LOC128209690 [Mya arenaria]|uniref:uncharacterized protein LOC128209690 n=1 Tax=Mya arenaria TaxID=6604 RepID=UPI0022E246F7|nr:uncharacterized protein LOC128209690 [Mya arenaria]
MKEQNDHRNTGTERLSERRSGNSTICTKEPETRQVELISNNVRQCNLQDGVSSFCCDCNSNVCVQCEKIHGSHQTIKVCEGSRLVKTNMSKNVKQLRNMILYANVVMKDMDSYLDKLDVHLAEITSEVMERALMLPEGCQNISDALINDIKAEHDIETDRVRNKISEFEQFVASAKSLFISCENMTNSTDDAFVTAKGSGLIKSVKGLIAELPEPLKDRCLYVLTPVPKVTDDQTLTAEQIAGEFSKVSVPWRIEVKRTGSFKPDSLNARFVTTMCPANDEDVWVVWQWGPQIHLVDKNGNVKKTISVGVKVDDICTHGDTLVVSSHEAKCIKILDNNHEVIKTISMDLVPRGVMFNDSNELVTCCVQNLHHKKGDTSTVMVTNVEREEQTELPCREHLVQPWRVAVNVNDDICVSDRNKGQVLIFDHEGTLKTSYSGPDNDTRHALAPHAIVCDKYGQILIVDYTNHTVHVLDPLGRFRGFLIMDTELEKRAIFMGTSSPFAITVDSVGDVWVGNKFGYLTVLKYCV